jgi:hypothetical protein
MLALVERKYFRSDKFASHTCSSRRADVGPCSASAATLSEMSSMPTFKPDEFPVNQRRFGSAAVQRNT